MKKKSKSALTRLLDTVFSKIVRKTGQCVRCGSNQSLQAAHIYSRKYRSIRWEMLNVLCLCAKCHFWWHYNPIEGAEFARQRLGELDYERLKQLRNEPAHFTRDNLEFMYAELLQKYSEGI